MRSWPFAWCWDWFARSFSAPSMLTSIGRQRVTGSTDGKRQTNSIKLNKETKMKKTSVEELIKANEGYRGHGYHCSKGQLTIGYGRNIDKNSGLGIDKDEAALLLRHDIKRVIIELESCTCYLSLDKVRQAAMVDMCFQLGLGKFLGFRKTLAAMQAGDYRKASKEMLRGSKGGKSPWAIQTPERAARISKMVLTGEWPKDL